MLCTTCYQMLRRTTFSLLRSLGTKSRLRTEVTKPQQWALRASAEPSPKGAAGAETWGDCKARLYPPARKQYEPYLQWFVAVTWTPSRGRQGSPQFEKRKQIYPGNSLIYQQRMSVTALLWCEDRSFVSEPSQQTKRSKHPACTQNAALQHTLRWEGRRFSAGCLM